MSTSTNNTESKTDSTETKTTSSTGYESTPSEDDKKIPLPEDSKTDDFGYSTENEDKPAPKKDDQPAPKEDDKPIENPATGYGKDQDQPAPKEDDKPAPKEDDKPLEGEEAYKKEILEAVASLGEGYNKEKISKFAIENKLTKSQLEAYVNMTKAEEAELVKSQQEALKAQRSSWKEDLLKDSTFGGENFDKNVDRVEKLLQKNMPETKKMLTEKGGMLPPYIMRDLLGIAKALNPTTNFVAGGAPEPKEDKGNFLDDLYS
jgi:hypothetical protein